MFTKLKEKNRKEMQGAKMTNESGCSNVEYREKSMRQDWEHLVMARGTGVRGFLGEGVVRGRGLKRPASLTNPTQRESTDQ